MQPVDLCQGPLGVYPSRQGRVHHIYFFITSDFTSLLSCKEVKIYPAQKLNFGGQFSSLVEWGYRMYSRNSLACNQTLLELRLSRNHKIENEGGIGIFAAIFKDNKTIQSIQVNLWIMGHIWESNPGPLEITISALPTELMWPIKNPDSSKPVSKRWSYLLLKRLASIQEASSHSGSQLMIPSFNWWQMPF